MSKATSFAIGTVVGVLAVPFIQTIIRKVNK